MSVLMATEGRRGDGRTDAERLAAVAAMSRAGASTREAWLAWDDGLDWVEAAGVLVGPARDSRVAADAERATRLAMRAGVPLADVLDTLALLEAQREEAEIARDVAAAGPRASARTLMWLPVAGLALGIIVDSRVLGVLASGLGVALLVIAGLLTWAGRHWLGVLVASAQSDEPGIELVTVCALLSASVRAGLDVTGALAITGEVWHHQGADETGLQEVAYHLRRGEGWGEAWTACSPALMPLERALRPAWEKGASPVAALDALAQSTLARRKAAALTAAAELGVRMTLPLTLCLLPAFIVIGVVPLIAAIGAGVVGDVAPAIDSLPLPQSTTQGEGGPTPATEGVHP